MHFVAEPVLYRHTLAEDKVIAKMLVSGNVQLGMNADHKAFFHNRNGDDPSVHKGALAFGRPMVQPLSSVLSLAVLCL